MFDFIGVAIGILFAILIVSGIIFLIGYYAILNPIVNKKKEMFDDKVLKQTEIQNMNNIL